MKSDSAKILDKCIEKIQRGETTESCLTEYPNMREKLEPLLDVAQSIYSLPKVTPSDEYRRVSRARLITRIREESGGAETAKSGFRIPVLDDIAVAWQRFLHANMMKKVAIPVTLALIIALIANLFGTFNIFSPSTALASQCTLSILSGSVEIQNPDADTSQQGIDGMTLNVGTRIKTASDSHALLTFFEGSSIKLEPNTDVEIQQVEYSEEQPATIILKQWLGRTWSRVVKMADPGSHYQIETPSATAIVRGTLFTTEVEETGLTRVTTTEGLVSVEAQGQEVYIPPDQQTEIEKGTAPSEPVTLPDPKSEIIITIDMPAIGSISDPTGSSTGILPTGLAFNQIQGSYSSSPSEDTQIITITEPVSGEYIITLRYLSEGTARFRIQGRSDGKVTFNYTGDWSTKKKSGRLIHLNLQVDDGIIVNSDINMVEPLGNKAPEKIVETGSTSETEAQDDDTQDESIGGKKGTDEQDISGDKSPAEKKKDGDETNIPGSKGKDGDETNIPGSKGEDDDETDVPGSRGKDDDETDVPGSRGKDDDRKDSAEKDVPGNKGKAGGKKDKDPKSNSSDKNNDKR